VFSYDAMVHFDHEVVAANLREMYRVLAPGGRAVLHRSANDRFPGMPYKEVPHWRNVMPQSLFRHYAIGSGFKVLKSLVIPWDRDWALDCFSLLEK
jgi:hypothetical protein